MQVCSDVVGNREREKSTQGDRVLFSSVGSWEGFLGVKITQSPYFFIVGGKEGSIFNHRYLMSCRALPMVGITHRQLHCFRHKHFWSRRISMVITNTCLLAECSRLASNNVATKYYTLAKCSHYEP